MQVRNVSHDLYDTYNYTMWVTALQTLSRTVYAVSQNQKINIPYTARITTIKNYLTQSKLGILKIHLLYYVSVLHVDDTPFHSVT